MCKPNYACKSNEIEVQTVSCDAPDDGPNCSCDPNVFTSFMLQIQLYQSNLKALSILRTLSMIGMPCQPTSSIHSNNIISRKGLKILIC